ncbi:MAG: hypothetical protein ABI068_00260 [Ktedonobacterales bacterium]
MRRGAQRKDRRHCGIDITPVTLMKARLLDTFGPEIVKQYTVTGEPTTFPDAEKLAANDKFHFQVWALGLVGARPIEVKKSADRGIDERLYFHEGALC